LGLSLPEAQGTALREAFKGREGGTDGK